jgi:hypothetical protein
MILTPFNYGPDTVETSRLKILKTLAKALDAALIRKLSKVSFESKAERFFSAMSTEQ